MDIPHPSVWLHQTLEEEDDDSTLLRYLIQEDQPNYELLDDSEEINAMVAAMDKESSFHRTIHVRRLVPRDHADGEDIPFPKNIAEAEELAAKTRESRKAMDETIKVLREEFDNALKKTNEDLLFTEEFLRREQADALRPLNYCQIVGEACVAAVVVFPLLMVPWI